MLINYELIIVFLISLISAFLVTPIIKQLAIKLDAVDRPDNIRKTHINVRASMGGLAIFIGTAFGILYIQPVSEQMVGIIIGAIIITITGLLDDRYELNPLMKLIGQILAAFAAVYGGVRITLITLPIIGVIEFNDLASYIITIFWIIAVVNAINLIDGLDGLAGGISAIALTTMLVIAWIDGRLLVVQLALILISSIIGFLFHNFYPAKIFMGDTGALFLGYAISVISVIGLFKNVAIFSFIIPIIIIAVPVIDTILAIIRRIINRQGIGTADKEHIHYKLIKMGYTHKQTVLILYGFSAFFGIIAIILSSTALQIIFVMICLIIAVQLILLILLKKNMTNNLENKKTHRSE